MSQYNTFLNLVDGFENNVSENSKYKFVELEESGILFIFDKEGNLLDTYNTKLSAKQRMTEEEYDTYKNYKNRLEDAKYVKQVNKYGNLLHEFIDSVNLRIEEEKYWDLDN